MQVYSLRSAIHAAWFHAAIVPARHDRRRQGGRRNYSALRAASEFRAASMSNARVFQVPDN